MSKPKTENIMLSLRGSVVFPRTKINIKFLQDFNSLIRSQIARHKTRRFFIFVGGGETDNYYQDTAEKVVGKIKNEDLDWLGIKVTKLNAHLLRTIFRDIAYPVIVEHYDRRPQLNDKQVVVCAGWQPGWTTDFDMVFYTKIFPALYAVSLCKVDYIYDSDPFKNPKARPLSNICWTDYLEIMGDWRSVTRKIPFDPIAAKMAQKLRQSIYIVEGNNLVNLDNLLEGKKYIGTKIINRNLDLE